MESHRDLPRCPSNYPYQFSDNAYNNSLTRNGSNTVNGNHQSRTTNNDSRRTYEEAENRRWERARNDNRYARGVNNGAQGTVNFGYVPQRESNPHDQNRGGSPGYNPGYSSGLNAETQPRVPPFFLDSTSQRSQQRAESDSNYTPHQNGAYWTRCDRNDGDYRNPQPNQLHSGFSQAAAYLPDTVIEQRPGPLNRHSQRQLQDFNVRAQEAYSGPGQEDITGTPFEFLYPTGTGQNHDSGRNPEPFHETYESDPSNVHSHIGNDRNIAGNRYEVENHGWERTWNDNRYARGVNNGAQGTVNFGYIPQRESNPYNQRSPGYNPGYNSEFNPDFSYGFNAETQPESPPSFLDPTLRGR